jgi:hypothetical protein
MRLHLNIDRLRNALEHLSPSIAKPNLPPDAFVRFSRKQALVVGEQGARRRQADRVDPFH